MAEFQMQCPNCSCMLVVDETWVGSTVECPNCQAQIVVTPNYQNPVAAAPNYQNPIVEPPKKDTASLVCGILGLVFFFACFGWILSLIGLIIGCKKKYKTGIILGGVGLAVNALGTILVLVAMLLPALNSAREKARRVQCMNNIKQIGIAITMYQMDHDDNTLPARGTDGMDLLRDRGYLTDANVFQCPSNETGYKTYVYIGEGTSVNYAPSTPIVIERPDNHTKYINVLYGDGHVEGKVLPKDFYSVKDIVEYLLQSDYSLPEHVKSKLLRNARKYD